MLKSRTTTSAPTTIEELKRAEAATKARLDGVRAKRGERQARYDVPAPDDTPETLVQLEKELADLDREERLANANHQRAVAALADAEKAAERNEIERQSAELVALTDEIVKTTPAKIRKLAAELVATTAHFTQVDRRLVELNKKRLALGLEGLPLSEHLMRAIPAVPDREVEEDVEVTEPADGGVVFGLGRAMKKTKKKRKRVIRGRARIVPSPYASVLEIPGFVPGEADLRVAGSYPPAGIWIDSCGCPRR
jgi:hypothetical protein